MIGRYRGAVNLAGNRLIKMVLNRHEYATGHHRPVARHLVPLHRDFARLIVRRTWRGPSPMTCSVNDSARSMRASVFPVDLRPSSVRIKNKSLTHGPSMEGQAVRRAAGSAHAV